ncbi:uncharacterized protein BDW43DRAFT_266502 [Aspergillus alliaceus]|uniref:uncharacterized protein n=1 Tax=Petromyces alliaceus TaxID=209559 RepID=UPI0012A66AFA|nr:uncharacterized protein BDW43DRAFT_266502 [Aspergillus alliaceus]KAB8236930.1 hypothetical protein BDW43DRAFT_266502 [Aspergillus alliaceus]
MSTTIAAIRRRNGSKHDRMGCLTCRHRLCPSQPSITTPIINSSQTQEVYTEYFPHLRRMSTFKPRMCSRSSPATVAFPGIYSPGGEPGCSLRSTICLRP